MTKTAAQLEAEVAALDRRVTLLARRGDPGQYEVRRAPPPEKKLPPPATATFAYSGGQLSRITIMPDGPGVGVKVTPEHDADGNVILARLEPFATSGAA